MATSVGNCGASGRGRTRGQPSGPGGPRGRRVIRL
ncbi:hypothetical protein BPC006_I2572 [Burkholderia pseudomallei BPC006]|nr:hypothetical protein BPC006_I2572 [Burkholderia pseudomallei BPC006]